MSEQKIANTFEKMRDTIDQYTKVVRQDGALWKSIEELGGDPAWLNDIKTALDAVYTAIEEADMGARMHLDMQDESADLNEAPPSMTRPMPSPNPYRGRKTNPIPEPKRLSGSKPGPRPEPKRLSGSKAVNEEPNEGNEFSGALAQAKQTGKKEFEVDGKKYKVQEGASLSPKYIKHLQLALRNWGPELSRSEARQLQDILDKQSIANIKTLMNADIPHLSQMAKLYLRNKTPGGMKNYSENNMFMGAVGKPYEDEDNPVKDAIMHRLSVSYGMEDLLKKYGLDSVEAAIDDVASFHDDAEELGSSDISIMVKQVMDNLESTNESLGYLKKLAGI